MRKRRFAVRNAIGWLSFLAVMGLGQGLHADFNQTTAEWRFDVYLDDRPIGFHAFRIESMGARRDVSIEAAFDVEHWLLPDYTYRHSNRERWDGNCLTGIDASTQTNRMTQTVDRSWSDDVRSGQRADCAMSFAYWNPTLLSSNELLDPQSGERRAVTVESRGEEFVPVGSRHRRAERFDLNLGQQKISVWYEADTHRWLRLEAPARGKRVLRYEPTALPTDEQIAQLTQPAIALGDPI